MKKNTVNTAAATALPPFHLVDAKANDWRRNFGITDDRAQEIITLISKSIVGDQLAPAMEAIGQLPTQTERLFGALAIGHGWGVNSGDNTSNPLADLLAEIGDPTDDDDDDNGDDPLA